MLPAISEVLGLRERIAKAYHESVNPHTDVESVMQEQESMVIVQGHLILVVIIAMQHQHEKDGKTLDNA